MVIGPDAPIFVPELVRCIADGRDPSIGKLFAPVREI
jgi:hypothetical protein